jgi:hypothetical protein
MMGACGAVLPPWGIVFAADGNMTGLEVERYVFFYIEDDEPQRCGTTRYWQRKRDVGRNRVVALFGVMLASIASLARSMH